MDQLDANTRAKPPSAFLHVPFDKMPQTALLRLPDVISITGLRRSAIYSHIQKGRFPRPERLTAHASGWRVGDLRSWLKEPVSWRADLPNDNLNGEG